MKKILSALCIISVINLVILPGFCKNETFIEDVFIEQALSQIGNRKQTVVKTIDDTFVEQTLNENLVKREYTYTVIEDPFVENNKNINPLKKRVVINEILPKLNTTTLNRGKEIFLADNEHSTPVSVKSKQYFSTDGSLQEGDYILFETVDDVKINNICYKKGTNVKARIETISGNKIWGVPADLIVGNFSINNIPLYGEINKTGANRSLWIYPTVYFTSFLFGAGLLLIPIKGGHAKIKTGEKFTIYARNKLAPAD